MDLNFSNTKRTVICADTFKWLDEVETIPAVVCGCPDKEETNMSMEVWLKWFEDVCCKILIKTESYAILVHTDRRYDGGLISKANLVLKAAERAKTRLLWHKIALRRDVGKIDLYRPAFMNMLCFSKTLTAGKQTPDVMHVGKFIYKNSLGTDIAKFAINYITERTNIKEITDPFAGQGTVLAIANAMGFDAVGVDIDPEQVEKSKNLYL